MEFLPKWIRFHKKIKQHAHKEKKAQEIYSKLDYNHISIKKRIFQDGTSIIDYDFLIKQLKDIFKDKFRDYELIEERKLWNFK